jgi:hypothetical protein
MAKRVYAGPKARQAGVVYLTGVGHGSYTTFTGHFYDAVFEVGNYSAAEPSGKIVHFLSCETAAHLGPDFVKNGCLAYFGYDEDFVFTVADPRLSRNGIDTKRYFGYPGGMKTADTLSLMHERVDDIPLLLGFMQQLNFPDLLERHLGSHHLHKGLSNGWLATVWLAFLLSQSNHRKVSVQDWAQNHIHTLETLIGQSLRPIEFADDRLSIILRRLHDADWSALEADLWQATCEVYEISYECIRLDATTSFGYHTITPDGLMQRGHSKDHRPDLPQLKLMAAAAQPTSHMLACDIVPGQSADDPLYLPLIRRVRQQLRQHGLLYSGDCKMSALATRAELVAEKDYYLMPLPRTGDNAEQIEAWIEQAALGKQPLQDLTRVDEKGAAPNFDCPGAKDSLARRVLFYLSAYPAPNPALYPAQDLQIEPRPGNLSTSAGQRV